MLKPGSKISEFNVPVFDHGKKGTLSSSALAGKWVVLSFYPFDFTGVCQSEVKTFNDLYGEFEKRGVTLLTASCDSVHSHEAWVKRDLGGELKYAMIGDAGRSLAQAFGVLNEEKGCAVRATFIIDEKGTVRAVLANDLPIGRSSDEILRLVDALQSGQACTMNWKK